MSNANTTNNVVKLFETGDDKQSITDFTVEDLVKKVQQEVIDSQIKQLLKKDAPHDPFGPIYLSKLEPDGISASALRVVEAARVVDLSLTHELTFADDLDD